MDEIDPIEGDIGLVGAGLGVRFEHTSKLKLMKYKKSIKTNDCERWIIAVEEENRRMKS